MYHTYQQWDPHSASGVGVGVGMGDPSSSLVFPQQHRTHPIIQPSGATAIAAVGAYRNYERKDLPDAVVLTNNTAAAVVADTTTTTPILPTKKKKKFVSKKEFSIPACSKEELIPLAKRPTKKRKKEYIIIDEEECEDWATDSRKTAKGGYAHTNSSKRKISQANAGNTPWNLGKQRSTAVKAKISASVRAINQTRVLAKLQRLGMTEEEWFKTKKEIKYLREKIRRTTKANRKGVTESLARQLQETLDTIDETKMDTNGGRKVNIN